MAANFTEVLHSCEICGVQGFNEEALRLHVTEHIGNTSCPFCNLSNVSPNEMLVHVNTCHSDCLTPDNEPYKFSAEDENATKRDADNNNTLTHLSSNSLKTGEESPSRKQLKLELNLSQKKVEKCLLCQYASANPGDLEEHINREHFDPISPSVCSTTLRTKVENSNEVEFRCPLCSRGFRSGSTLENHVNSEHLDVLSPGKPSNTTLSEPSSTSGQMNSGEQCPVCGQAGFSTHFEMAAHVEKHFLEQCDGLLASEMEQKERKALEQQEFDKLRAQFGMDNQGNFKDQSLTNMQRAVYAGKMSLTDYHERQVELRKSENTGTDDGNSCTKGLIQCIQELSVKSPSVLRRWLCTSVDHYASTYGDRGWGCGYRNLQMLLSALMQHTNYSGLLSSKLLTQNNQMPSISRLQKHIEWAWQQGFDPQGAEQLGCRVFNTRKWIGATEIVTALSALRIRCHLVDFHRPTDSSGGHPELFRWVLDYFNRHNQSFTLPLYLQHQGHSRTIIGMEQCRSFNQLLVLDPSHSTQQMGGLMQGNGSMMRLLRRGLSGMKARQYQIVAVYGVMENEKEFQESKVIRSTRIPRDY